MFLQRLAEYADRLGLPPAMYQRKAVRYILLLDQDGRYLNIVDCASEENKQGIMLDVPNTKRSAVLPLLLADTAEYVFGLGQDGSDPTKVQKKHEAFVAHVQQCAQDTGDPTVQAVAAFLEHLNIPLLRLPEDFAHGTRITFEVGGVRPIDLPIVQQYWAKVAAVGDITRMMQCLVCGKNKPAVERLPIAIHGVPRWTSIRNGSHLSR